MTSNNNLDELPALVDHGDEPPIFSTVEPEFSSSTSAGDATEQGFHNEDYGELEEDSRMQASHDRGYSYTSELKKRTFDQTAQPEGDTGAEQDSGRTADFHMNLRHPPRQKAQVAEKKKKNSKGYQKHRNDSDDVEDVIEHETDEATAELAASRDWAVGVVDNILSSEDVAAANDDFDATGPLVTTDNVNENVVNDAAVEVVINLPESPPAVDPDFGSQDSLNINTTYTAPVNGNTEHSPANSVSGSEDFNHLSPLEPHGMATDLTDAATNNDILEDGEPSFATEPCIIGMHQEYFFGVGFTDKSTRATSKCIVGLCGLHLKYMYGLQEADTKLGNSVIGNFTRPNEFKNRGTSLFAFIPANTRRGECYPAFNVGDIVVPTAAAGKLLMEKVALLLKSKYLKDIYETLSITEDEELVPKVGTEDAIKVPKFTEPKWLHDILPEQEIVFNMSRPMRAFFQRQAEGRKSLDSQRVRQVKMWDDSIAPSENYNSLVEEAKLHGEISTNRKIHEFYLQTHLQEDPDFPKVLTTLNIVGVSQNVTRKFSYRCLVAHGERFAYQQMFQYLFTDILVSTDKIKQISGIVLNAIRGCDVPVKHKTGVHTYAVNAPNVAFVSGLGLVAIKAIMKDEELVLLTGDPSKPKFEMTGIEPHKYDQLRVTYRSPTVACKPTNILKSTSQIVDITSPSAFSGYGDRDIVI